MKKWYYRITEYLLMFMMASFIGWLYEVACVYVVLGKFINRGVLHLPFCPIYAFGSFVLYAIFHRVRNVFVLFLGSVFVTTVVELAVSYIAEYKFNTILWTYEDWPLNYQGRVSLVSSCIFGLLALFFFKLMKPALDRLFASRARKIVSVLTIVLFVGCAIWEWKQY